MLTIGIIMGEPRYLVNHTSRSNIIFYFSYVATVRYDVNMCKQNPTLSNVAIRL